MLFRNLRVHQVFGANTEVGKTLFATALCRTSQELGEAPHYLKPVGTGGQGDDWHVGTFSPETQTSCLHYFDEPVSPHLAAEIAKSKDSSYTPPSDQVVADGVSRTADSIAKALGKRRAGSLIVETAGGPHSPTLSGTSQVDAYRSLRLPTILVASPHLGGISTTISAYESLLLRGYDVDALLCLHETYYSNWRYFEQWSQERGISFGVLERPPEALSDREKDIEQMKSFYENIANPRHETGLPENLSMQSVVRQLKTKHEDRLRNLDSMPRRTRDSVWWPFVQHTHIKEDKDVMVIDSAYKDTFNVYSSSSPTSAANSTDDSQANTLVSTYDGSASWWTQCLGHANVELTLAAAQASGRYGHVIFPNATHEPALQLTETLLNTVGDGWADRVFFSDDGSTGMEVGIKMGLRHAANRLRREEQGKRKEGGRRELGILGLKGSYHGDTIGAMDACEGGVYSATVEWYRGRGFWLDPPLVKIENGEPVIRFEGEQWEIGSFTPESSKGYSDLNEVYDIEARLRNGDPLVEVYNEHIKMLVEKAQAELGLTFGSLVIEPIVMGAGGMLFVDPLFQRLLVDYSRSSASLQLPIIYDEVFIGLYRLGKLSGSDVLGVQPDIACYAKILTGGLVPMAVTLANEKIFNNFLGEQKQEALLHGHSYTAHPIGCAVANKTLDIITKLDREGEEWNAARASWSPEGSEQTEKGIFSVWSKDFVNKVSSLDGVDGAMAMGTVLVIYLRDVENAGYQSTASADLLRRLRYPDMNSGEALPIHARPLGNTVYWMSSLNTPSETLRKIERAIWAGLTETPN